MNKVYRPAPPRAADPWDGVLLVDKPSGPTSHDIVAKIRRHFGIKKVGHGGTLDPMATGLLLILLGKGTKLSGQIMGSDKVYEGTMRLGVTTNTQDRDGKVEAERDASHVTREQVEEQMRKLTGDIMQMPPMVSAIKRDGVPLYKLARQGQTVEREPRLIHIYQFQLLSFSPPSVSFRVRCTKGTYVRTLCADIGEALGCGAHLSSLRRTQSGAFLIDRAIALDDLLRLTADEMMARVVAVSEFALQ